MSAPEEVASMRQEILDMQVELNGNVKTHTRLMKTIDEQEGKISALQTQVEAADSTVQEAPSKEQEDRIHDLEARLEEKDQLLEMHTKFISDMHLVWTRYQSERDLEIIEPLEADTPQEANKPVSESRSTSKPQDSGIDTESPIQEPELIPKPHVEEVFAKMAQVDLEDQPTGSTAAPGPVGPGTSSTRTRSPPEYPVPQTVALNDEGLVRGKLPVPENKSQLSRDTSRRRKGDDSPEGLGRGRVPPVGPMSSSLRPSQLPPKNTVKPSGQAASNKVEADKSAKSSYSSMLQAPKLAAPRPPILAAYNPNDPKDKVRAWLAEAGREENEEDDGYGIDSSDSEPEAAKTTPPASNAAFVMNQSSTTEDRGPKRGLASNAALVTDESSTTQVPDSKRRRLN